MRWILSVLFVTSIPLLGFADQPAEDKIEAILNEGIETNLIVIADTSGSMKERPATGEEQPKIDIAKEALVRFVRTLPPAVRVGMIVFHGCRPRWVVPVGPGGREAVIAQVPALAARGSTPISGSLKLALDDFRPRLKGNPYSRNVIILVTDGEETCSPPDEVGGVASQITNAGMELHAIGFDLPDRDSELKRVSTKYYRAGDSKELEQGLATIQAELSLDATIDPVGVGR